MEQTLTHILLEFLYKRALRPPRFDTRHERWVLEHSNVFRWAMSLFCLFFMALAVASMLVKPPVTFAALIFCGFTVLGLFAVAEAFGTRVYFSDASLEQTSPWHFGRRILWEDVREVRFSPSNRWFIVYGRTTKIRVSFYLVGIRAVGLQICRMVAPEKRSRANAGLLQLGITETAQS